MRHAFAAVLCSLLFVSTFTEAAGKDGNPSKLPSSWYANFGYWELNDDTLVCRELKEDKHAGAARLKTPLTDGSITCRVKFEDGAKFFHIGFDPAPGTLDKKGHLYSLVLTPQSAMIKKHRDKNREDSKDETLATVRFEKPLEGWHSVKLTASGKDVRVSIDNQYQLTASDDSFGVKKPGVVFRVGGGDVHVDQIEVAVEKP
ncbi:hypothetical protein [Rubinisphaera margarita]|uniref:hypothetical protein n=1 Tax=Rubinisphaera margarita TaxID=2909586 RepID=UPI001EE94504|nr:hypothetical protein [Rubinisphaera margarita]MCG6158086.1 hypothetical protein [Rubinisphaera margarita]